MPLGQSRKSCGRASELLGWDEYERLVRILVGLGIRKVRVTGGEPLVRPGVEDFVARLKAIGVADLSMTTNGYLLAERCDRLVAAGMDRINISLDSLDREKFERITRTKPSTRSWPASTPRRPRGCGP